MYMCKSEIKSLCFIYMYDYDFCKFSGKINESYTLFNLILFCFTLVEISHIKVFMSKLSENFYLQKSAHVHLV